MSREQLNKMGIWPYRPHYGEGRYNNRMNIVNSYQMDLFEHRKKREPEDILEATKLAIKLRGEEPPSVFIFEANKRSQRERYSTGLTRTSPTAQNCPW